MLYKTPHTLPQWDELWQGLGRPHPFSIAQALGVDVRTVYRWMRSGKLPRTAHLALFWVSPWGVSLIDSARQFELDTLRGMVRALRIEQAHAAAQRARDQAMAAMISRQHLAANEAPRPAFEPVTVLAFADQGNT